MTAIKTTDPLSKESLPLDNGIIVSVRDQIEFGDDQIRRGRILGWHISTGLSEAQEEMFEDVEPQLEYQIQLLNNQEIYWVPAENVLGFLKGV